MEFNDKAAFVTAEHPVSEKIVLLPNGVKDADIQFNGEKKRAGLC